MPQPNWIIIIFIGAIVGYLFPHLVKSFKYIVRRFRKETIEGLWYTYFVTNEGGEIKIAHKTWRIQKGYVSKFNIESYLYDGKEKKAVYKGKVYFERNFWLFRYEAIDHKEEVSGRLFDPITNRNLRTWGLYMALDFQGNPISGPFLASKQELSLEEASSLLMKQTKINTNPRLLMVKSS